MIGRGIYSPTTGRALYSPATDRALYGWETLSCAEANLLIQANGYAPDATASEANSNASEDASWANFLAASVSPNGYGASARQYVQDQTPYGYPIKSTVLCGSFRFAITSDKQTAMSRIRLKLRAGCTETHYINGGGSQGYSWVDAPASLRVIFSASVPSTGADIAALTSTDDITMTTFNDANRAAGDALPYPTSKWVYLGASASTWLKTATPGNFYVILLLQRTGYSPYPAPGTWYMNALTCSASVFFDALDIA